MTTKLEQDCFGNFDVKMNNNFYTLTKLLNLEPNTASRTSMHHMLKLCCQLI